MSREVNLYDEYVIKNILATNQFNIEAVNNLESLKSKPFFKEEYPIIENLIKVGDIEAIKAFSGNGLCTGDYIDVMLFNNEREKKYIVTVYDNDLLGQDPQVIDIYKL